VSRLTLPFARNVVELAAAAWPGVLLGDDAAAVRAGPRDSLRALLELDFDHLLFAHGDPLIGGGEDALRSFLDLPII